MRNYLLITAIFCFVSGCQATNTADAGERRPLFYLFGKGIGYVEVPKEYDKGYGQGVYYGNPNNSGTRYAGSSGVRSARSSYDSETHGEAYGTAYRKSGLRAEHGAGYTHRQYQFTQDGFDSDGKIVHRHVWGFNGQARARARATFRSGLYDGPVNTHDKYFETKKYGRPGRRNRD